VTGENRREFCSRTLMALLSLIFRPEWLAGAHWHFEGAVLEAVSGQWRKAAPGSEH
jgi:hypothetical protein